MRLLPRTLRASAAACMALFALAACGDDNPSGPASPLAPTNVAVASPSATSAVISWNAVANATRYQVERAPAGGAFAVVSGDLTTTTYTDDDVQASTQYQYRVRAFNGSAAGNYSSTVSVTTGAAGPRTRTIAADITVNTTLYADTVYTLSGYVKVANGATLTIQPGTKIVGDTTVAGSSLWILRGATIDAQGTAAAPIVFTSARSAGSRKPGDWGGIIIVGNGRVNRTANPIFTEGPAAESENYAGGTDNPDNSGTLKYVRIEFAGYDVSNGGGQELNSLSSYAVGSGTHYDYVQSMLGLDDSFEFFGGAVDGRHLVSYEAGDDHFDWTEGYSGRNQYMIALQTLVPTPQANAGTVSSDPRGFEGDGCENNKAGCTYANAPYSMPVFANFTVIGPGPGVFGTTDGNGAVVRRGSGGTFVNGIIARWPGVGFSIRDAESNALLQVDSLFVRNLILSDNGSNFEAPGTNFGSQLNTAATSIREVAGVGTLFTSLTTASLDWTPAAGSAAATGGMADFTGTVIAPRVTNFFGGTLTATTYVGAADPAGGKWWSGWTVYVTN